MKPREYRVRVSSRAKYPRLTMSQQDGLIVVVPRRFNQRIIPDLLALPENQRWMERTAAQLAELAEARARPDARVLPETLELKAIDELWSVSYRPEPVPGGPKLMKVHARVDGSRSLLVTGETTDLVACRAIVGLWLRAKARRDLGSMLRATAGKLGLSYTKVDIRQQRTRWGSCSSTGTISLNIKLMFLPRPIVQYVLMHELCHLAQPNHSPAFWRLLGTHLPEYARLRKQLGTADRYVPSWLDL